jgi:oxalate decarboxylase/phosphoglucose isomerase-like protein (cupin superfamily)
VLTRSIFCPKKRVAFILIQPTLTDGKAVVNYTDGKSEAINIKAGEYGYGDPERPHTIENVGDKPIKFLLVELNEHPYKSQ